MVGHLELGSRGSGPWMQECQLGTRVVAVTLPVTPSACTLGTCTSVRLGHCHPALAGMVWASSRWPEQAAQSPCSQRGPGDSAEDTAGVNYRPRRRATLCTVSPMPDNAPRLWCACIKYRGRASSCAAARAPAAARGAHRRSPVPVVHLASFVTARGEQHQRRWVRHCKAAETKEGNFTLARGCH